ncbi:MAG: hypothetical protein AAF653_02455 [Chloroflexota bacterium]
MKATVSPSNALCILRDEEHATVKTLIDTLTDAEMTYPDSINYGLYPDQSYSFKDLLAHMNAYEVHALDAYAAWEDGSQGHPIVADVLYRAREVHYASTADRDHLSLAEMIDLYLSTAEKLEQLYANMSGKMWNMPYPMPSRNPDAAPVMGDVGGMLESIVVAPPRPLYRHMPVHIPNVERYINRVRNRVKSL